MLLMRRALLLQPFERRKKNSTEDTVRLNVWKINFNFSPFVCLNSFSFPFFILLMVLNLVFLFKFCGFCNFSPLSYADTWCEKFMFILNIAVAFCISCQCQHKCLNISQCKLFAFLVKCWSLIAAFSFNAKENNNKKKV